jgi:hypothetical protein
MVVSHAKYFKQYRKLLGLSNIAQAKEFLAGKDIVPSIDYDYINLLNLRICEIIRRLNEIPNTEFRRNDIDSFIQGFIFEPYALIQQSGILSKLNNQGRRPEEVLFSWLRGFVIVEYFTPTIAKIFDLEITTITKIGDDDFSSEETFKRTPRADLEITLNSQKIRIEVQSGFQGINDVKEHKVREARNSFISHQIKTICIHFDIYNGQVAFIQLDQIFDNDLNWVTRQQMEGQTVFSIDQNYFKWRLIDSLPELSDLDLVL